MTVVTATGVDRLLDLARTMPNVTGDLVTSLIVARSEGLWSPRTMNANPPTPHD